MQATKSGEMYSNAGTHFNELLHLAYTGLSLGALCDGRSAMKEDDMHDILAFDC